MRQVGEVLRLSAQGFSYRRIGQSVGISASTVQSYLERAQQARLSWPLPEELDDAAIEARLFTRSEEELRPGRPEPSWREVHRDHKRGKHVTLQLLHLEYKAAHPDGLSYTQFCVHYRRWLGQQDLVMRPEYAAGERMFVDFAGDTVPITDPETGEVWNAQVFVSVLGASGYLYAEAARSQRLSQLLQVTSRNACQCRCRLTSSSGGSRLRPMTGAAIPLKVRATSILALRPLRHRQLTRRPSPPLQPEDRHPSGPRHVCRAMSGPISKL